ncbi:MAG: SBBP repeat-containing protein [Candidatus Eisenbacteria bacterium]
MRYEVKVSTGADAGRVQFAYEGAERVVEEPGGSFLVETSVGSLREVRAVAGGSVGVFMLVQGDVAPLGDTGSLAPADNPSALLWSTFFGGSYDDEGQSLVLDASGNAMVTGHTWSSDFPTTPGAYDTFLNGGSDVFVAKLSASGGTLLWSAFLGGGSYDWGYSLALDGSGDAVVTGWTWSSNFPTTPGAYDTSLNGYGDVFVAKLSASGSTLLWSTFVGGSSDDIRLSLALDGSGNAVFTGWTTYSFPVTPGAYDTSFNGGECDVFVAKLSASGSALLWSTFLGGSSDDWAVSLVLDESGNPVVTGGTESSDFPTTPGAYDTSQNGGDYDVFVAKLSASGGALLWSTFLGGSSDDYGYSLVLDAPGNAVVTGETASSDFPTTPGAYDTSLNGYGDVFVAKLSASGSALLWSTFLGGSDSDVGYSLVLDASGNAVVTGYTWSSDFPTTPGAYDTSFNGGYCDVFVAMLSASGNALLGSTFLGGSSSDGYWWSSLVLDASGNAVVTGWTYSSDFPTTPGAYDTSFNGGSCDVFVAKLQWQPEIAISPDSVWAFTVNHVVRTKTVRVSNTGGDGLIWTAGASQADTPKWLDVTPISGVIMAGGYQDVSVIMDARELEGGDYSGFVTFTSNDLTDPTVTVPVLFRVTRIVPVAYLETEFNMLPVSSESKWVVCEVGLPAGADPAMVDVATLTLTSGEGTVMADPATYWCVGPEASGEYKLRFGFDRPSVESILPEGMSVRIQVSGKIASAAYFIGEQTIVVVRPALVSPDGSERLNAGENTMMTWTVPSGVSPESYALYFSPDGGATWQEVATGIASQSLATTVPATATTQGLFRVYAFVGGKAVGYGTSDQPITIVGQGAGVPGSFKPTTFALAQNSPNPFKGSTTILFDLPNDSSVRLDITDVSGRSVRTLVSGTLQANRYYFKWDGRDRTGHEVASGVYFYRVVAGNFGDIKRMVVVK